MYEGWMNVYAEDPVLDGITRNWKKEDQQKQAWIRIADNWECEDAKGHLNTHTHTR